MSCAMCRACPCAAVLRVCVCVVRPCARCVCKVTSGVAVVGQSKGDLFVVTADDTRVSPPAKYLFASFHG